jgi:hypothetical protein
MTDTTQALAGGSSISQLRLPLLNLTLSVLAKKLKYHRLKPGGVQLVKRVRVAG